ncbi:reverse transcriptase-like protein [Jeotgalibacillus proteolyticus]|uniref:reverse transcriptase-like protein n=1 Tax=Jeotgalibacillus proteolyticus TaxID=2082395 RepID=UPI001FD6DBE5|nr:reverse transcriptase-like protein [Jeotgalibacillus proteolyticus]
MRLHFQYKHPALPSVSFSSDWMPEHISLKMIQDIEKTGRMKELKIEDDMGQTWTLKEYKKLLTKAEEQKTNLQIHFDGSFNPQTSQSGIGVILTYQEAGKTYRVRENALLNHLSSNNEAEYAALYKGMQLVDELGVSSQNIKITGDSLVVVNQVTGEWPCYEEQLNKWIDKIEALSERNKLKLDLKAVRRNDNKEADKLASQALEGVAVQSKTEI